MQFFFTVRSSFFLRYSVKSISTKDTMAPSGASFCTCVKLDASGSSSPLSSISIPTIPIASLAISIASGISSPCVPISKSGTETTIYFSPRVIIIGYALFTLYLSLSIFQGTPRIFFHTHANIFRKLLHRRSFSASSIRFLYAYTNPSAIFLHPLHPFFFFTSPPAQIPLDLNCSLGLIMKLFMSF